MRQNSDESGLCRGTVRAGRERSDCYGPITQAPEAEILLASLSDVAASLRYLVRWMLDESGITKNGAVSDIDAIGHRIVHGGELFAESAVITDWC